MSDVRCPVCGQAFENEQGKGGHIASMKDAEHEAFRTLGQLPSPALAEPGRQLLLPASTEPPSQVPEPALKPQAQAEPLSPGEGGSQQKDEPSREVIRVSFEPPKLIEPLLPELLELGAGQKAEGGASPGKAPSVTVPLEPILAGTTALSLNAFLLREEGDGQLTTDMVRGTGFPSAVEGCLRLYFPDLALDHPVVALIASSAGLAMLVASLKGKHKPQAREEPKPAPPAEAPQAPAPEPEGTGDSYWDSILRQAGGGPA